MYHGYVECILSLAVLNKYSGKYHDLEPVSLMEVKSMSSTARDPEIANNSPNLFELKGPCTEITYSTSSFVGPPQFSYRDHQRQVNVSGEKIHTLQTEIGELVTVTLEVVPDFLEVTFTLLLPTIQLPAESHEGPIRTEGILTTKRSSIGGPRFIEGQIQTYCIVTIHGTAKRVNF